MKIALLHLNESPKKRYSLDYYGQNIDDDFDSVKTALFSLGHQVSPISIDDGFYESLRKEDFDLAFNLCDDGIRGNSLLEPHIPAILDILQLPYTGSGLLTLAICLDKAKAKKLLSFHNIPTPCFQVFSNPQEELSLEFPLIVKPLHEDGSIGIKEDCVVRTEERLREKVEFIIKNYRQQTLVEEFIEGREINVGILGNINHTILPLSEIIFDDLPKDFPAICSYEAKWHKESTFYRKTPPRCPADLPPPLGAKIKAYALDAYAILGCQDYCRIDFRIDKENNPYILEVNPNPDISKDAGLALMAKAAGIEYEGLIERIVDFALQRYENSRYL